MFASLVVSLLAIIVMNRSWSRSSLATLGTPNPALWWVVAGAAALLALVFAVPPIRHLFAFGPIHVDDMAVSLAAGAGCLAWFEVLKAGASRWTRRRAASD
jgi:Ca2+-transporting ATPase